MQKNVGQQKWTVFAFQDKGGANPGEPVAGDAANITANIRKDGGSGSATNDTNPGDMTNGYYVFQIDASESNADHLTLIPSSSTANVNVIAVPGAVWTSPSAFPDWKMGGDGYPPGLMNSTTITGLSSQTVFNLTAGSSDDDAYNGALVVITNTTPDEQKCVGIISDYTGATKTVTLEADPGIFTISNFDLIDIIATSTSQLATAAALAVVDTNVDTINTNVGTAGAGLTNMPISPANVTQISGSANAADRLEDSAETLIFGTASGTPTTTSMVSDVAITVDDQLKGRTIIFKENTTTAALQNQGTDITACTAASNTLTFTALTTAPVSGDTFVIV